MLRKWPLRGEQCDVSQAFSVNEKYCYRSSRFIFVCRVCPFPLAGRINRVFFFFIRKRAGISHGQIKVVCKNKVAVWWSPL